MTVTIFLIDDHHLVRQGLKVLLAAEIDFSVVGESGDGLEGIQWVQKLRPNVTVVDLMMPGINGLEVTRQISQLTKVIILSMHADEAYVLESLRNGAYGYVLKDSTAADLAQAIRMVMSGKRYLSPPLSERAIEMYMEKSQETGLDAYDLLTTREREVFQLMVQGLSTPAISEQLSLSARTVETYRTNVMRKLNQHTLPDLVRYAIKRGVLSIDQ